MYVGSRMMELSYGPNSYYEHVSNIKNGDTLTLYAQWEKNTYLFSSGNDHTDLTGGWTFGRDADVTKGQADWSNSKKEFMKIQPYVSGSNAWACTTNRVNLKKYGHLHVTYNFTNRLGEGKENRAQFVMAVSNSRPLTSAEGGHPKGFLELINNQSCSDSVSVNIGSENSSTWRESDKKTMTMKLNMRGYKEIPEYVVLMVQQQNEDDAWLHALISEVYLTVN